jgi:hypothetical protein
LVDFHCERKKERVREQTEGTSNREHRPLHSYISEQRKELAECSKLFLEMREVVWKERISDSQQKREGFG